MIVAAALTAALLACVPGYDLGRLATFTNYSGLPEGKPVWPRTENVLGLFALGFLLPAYTVTGFDASAHTSEETLGASTNVPRGIVRSVLVSGVAGWIMLAAIVLAAPDLDRAAGEGPQAFYWIVNEVLPGWLALVLYAGIALAQYLCGLATVTSASRMVYAFARDGGLPASAQLRHIDPTFRTPVLAIWVVAVAAVLFTIYTPVYSTITVVCVLFLYISYVLPLALGLLAYGRSWTQMGPWQIGRWYRPLAVVSVLGCAGLFVIGMQPPNEKAVYVVGGMAWLLALGWFGIARSRFAGPPHGVMTLQRQQEIEAAEQAVGQAPVVPEKPSS
jgi:amino acid transporter